MAGLGGLVKRSIATGRIVLAGEPKMAADFNEIYVQTLVPSTIFAQAVAAKILKVYPPALFVRRVCRKVVLGGGRPFADAGDVLSDLSRQIVDVMRVPRIILVHGTPLGNTRKH
jgi:hypothetical protein